MPAQVMIPAFIVLVWFVAVALLIWSMGRDSDKQG